MLFLEKKFRTIGFDIDQKRVNDLKKLFDKTNEIESKELEYVLNENVIENDLNGFYPTSKLGDLKVANIYIITVPTPVTKNKKPDFKPLFNASRSVGEIISKNDIVIYESTVYPGATEDECVPIIEKTSGLKYNLDFFVGYSPERINPGDKQRTLEKIIKVTSDQNAETAIKVDNLYKEIIIAGTYLAPNIKTAEAAKVIENSQRDINIAFVNELAKIFSLMDLDTNEVLDAASSKWNFLNFKPGLVGGHCIGVDPYYLAQKSTSLGYNPEIILAGRKINDSMSSFVSNEVLRLMQSKNININNSNVLIMGVTFKENCPDFRNTKVVDLYFQLISKVKNIDIYDPLVDKVSFKKEYKINIMGEIVKKKYELIILAVPHKEFENINLKLILKRKSVVYDIKNFLKMTVDGRL